MITRLGSIVRDFNATPTTLDGIQKIFSIKALKYLEKLVSGDANYLQSSGHFVLYIPFAVGERK